MKECFKKICKILLVIFLLAIPFILLPVKADSGFDTGYSGGGGGGYSGGGGSSWSGGGSSWSSGSHSSSSSYSGGGSASADDVIATFLFFLFIMFVIYMLSQKATVADKPSKTRNLNMYQDMPEEKIKEILPDENLGSLKYMARQIYLEVQEAWMNFDYDKMRELCTDELYNQYISQLESLKLKKSKNIMSGFDQEENRIIDVKQESGIVTVRVYLRMTFFDYIINEKTKDVIRGTQQATVTNGYILEFVRKTKKTKGEIKCPNCGAMNKIVASKKCEYCGSTIVTSANDFVLSKKTCETTILNN